MKHIFVSIIVLAACATRGFAGTETAPAPDGKDMKEMKQVAQTEQSDAGFYVAAYGGANFDTWYGNNRQTVSLAGTNVTSNSNLDSDWGGAGGIKAGYNFNSFALGNMWGLRLQPAVEAEGIYIGEDKSFSSGDFNVPNIRENFSTNSGDFFVNGILRFKNDSIVTPYIGGGVGLQYVTTHGVVYANPGGKATGLDTSDLDFAGQGLFGFDIAICRHVSLFTEYKFIDAVGTDGKSTNWPGGITYRFKPDQIEQNLITAGVKYTF